MNFFQKLFTTQPQVVKQTSLGDDKLFRALMDSLSELPSFILDRMDEYVNKGYLYNDHVYSIIKLISRAGAGIPWQLYEVKNRQKYNRYKSLISNPETFSHAIIAKTQALVDVDSHPLLDIIERPNPQQGQAEFVENLLGFKLLLGNALIHGIGPKSGENANLIKELHLLPPHMLKIKKGDAVNPIAAYVAINNDDIIFDAREVCHLKYWTPDYSSPTSHLWGMSPLKAGLRKVKVSNDGINSMAKAFQTLGRFGLFVMQNGGAIDFDENKAKDLEEKFYRKMDNQRIAFTGGNFKWEQAGMSPVDMGILEAGTSNLRDLCNLYGINSALLNDPENKVYNNMKEASKSMYTKSVIPEMQSIRDELNRWLVEPYNQKMGKKFVLDLDLQAIPELQEDLEKLVKQAKDMHWITPNEQRILTGYGRDEDNEFMDDYWFPSNLIQVGAPLPAEEESLKNINGFLEREGLLN